MKFLKTHYVSIILWAIGPPTFPLWATEMKEFLISQNTYFISVAVWSILFISFLWVKDRRRKNEVVPSGHTSNISFSYTLNEEDCYIEPEQSCSESFSHAVAWEHDEDDDGNLNVYSHSVALVFIQPRNVTKVELKSLNTNDELEIIVAHVESCSDHKKHSGVNVLCNEDVGIERLKLTVYFDD